ncbi:MAG: cyclic nucleotide-binding domain-containing protein [Gammaproteobacteria bacterium]|nr:cyclic nucleotide-binding domain-containing protein [Gammaproteobacteria bacterium]
MTTEEMIGYFRKNLICETLTRQEVATLREYLQEISFKKDEVIAEIGEVGDALYFVVNGKSSLYREEEGEAIKVASLKEGTLVGEMSFFDRKPRNVRMKADSKNVQMLVLTRPMYQRLKIEHPIIAVNLLENAIVSLDYIIRHMGDDIANLNHYLYGTGRH